MFPYHGVNSKLFSPRGDEITKDVEPLEFVIKWDGYYLADGPINAVQFAQKKFKWTGDVAAAKEFNRTLAERLVRFYNAKGYKGCSMKRCDTEC